MVVAEASAIGGGHTGKIALALLSAAEVPNFLAGLLPSLMTIRRFGAEDMDRKALRQGEVLGSVLSVTVGAGASLAARSWLPFLATMLVLVVLLAAYETAIRNPHPGAKPINDQ